MSNAKFLVFDTQFINLNTQFINVSHATEKGNRDNAVSSVSTAFKPLQNSSFIYTKYVVFDTQFLVFDTQFLVFDINEIRRFLLTCTERVLRHASIPCLPWLVAPLCRWRECLRAEGETVRHKAALG